MFGSDATGAGEDFIVILLFGLGRGTSGVSLTSFGQGLADALSSSTLFLLPMTRLSHRFVARDALLLSVVP